MVVAERGQRGVGVDVVQESLFAAVEALMGSRCVSERKVIELI